MFKKQYRAVIHLFGFLIYFTANAGATEFKVDPAHSNVGFTIRHFVSKVSGSFKNFEANFRFDEKKPSDSSGKFIIQASSIDTGNEKRDNHLRSADFFEIQKFPILSFESKKMASAGVGKYKLAGDITMHGVTQPATFDVEYLGAARDMEGKTRLGFTATCKVNRKDFGISWNKAMDKGGWVLGDEVELHLQIEAVEQKK